MEQRSYQLSFLSPAFMGDAHQAPRWRTPPIKHLLREWWRVAWTAEHGIDVTNMRIEEGRLFGHAADGNSQKSALRLRLVNGDQTAWTTGTQRGVEPLPTDLANSYAWFGLADPNGKTTPRSGIKPVGKERARELKIACPAEHVPLMEQTMALVKHFGQLGSRSRGGWGSVWLDDNDIKAGHAIDPFCKPLTACLQHDWASAIGTDENGPMIWQSQKAQPEWHNVMRRVASARKEVRTGLRNDLRATLGFAENGRMPSPLRWKLIDTPQGLAVRIYATPHQIPSNNKESINPRQLDQAWQAVARTLDNHRGYARSSI